MADASPDIIAIDWALSPDYKQHDQAKAIGELRRNLQGRDDVSPADVPRLVALLCDTWRERWQGNRDHAAEMIDRLFGDDLT